MEKKQIVFSMACTNEKQKRLIIKELKRIKELTGKTQAFILLESLYKLRESINQNRKDRVK